LKIIIVSTSDEYGAFKTTYSCHSEDSGTEEEVIVHTSTKALRQACDNSIKERVTQDLNSKYEEGEYSEIDLEILRLVKRIVSKE
jgi:hypothetical protein